MNLAFVFKPILTFLPKISVNFGGNYQKMKKYLFLLALAAIMMTACQQNAQKSAQSENDAAVITQQDKDLLAQAQLFFKPLPAAAENPDNMITEAKVKLGKHLYFDNRLSKDGNQSCNSCHNLDTMAWTTCPLLLVTMEFQVHGTRPPHLMQPCERLSSGMVATKMWKNRPVDRC